MSELLFVIDTNTLLSASLFEHSKPKVAYDEAKKLGRIIATFAEISDVLLRPQFEKYVPLSTRKQAIVDFRNTFIFKTPTKKIIACRDPKDDKFLELAVAAKAFCIITGDKDLLVLHPFRTIPILRASEFLDRFPLPSPLRRGGRS